MTAPAERLHPRQIEGISQAYYTLNQAVKHLAAPQTIDHTGKATEIFWSARLSAQSALKDFKRQVFHLLWEHLRGMYSLQNVPIVGPRPTMEREFIEHPGLNYKPVEDYMFSQLEQANGLSWEDIITQAQRCVPMRGRGERGYVASLVKGKRIQGLRAYRYGSWGGNDFTSEALCSLDALAKVAQIVLGSVTPRLADYNLRSLVRGNSLDGKIEPAHPFAALRSYKNCRLDLWFFSEEDALLFARALDNELTWDDTLGVVEKEDA